MITPSNDASRELDRVRQSIQSDPVARERLRARVAARAPGSLERIKRATAKLGAVKCLDDCAACARGEIPPHPKEKTS